MLAGCGTHLRVILLERRAARKAAATKASLILVSVKATRPRCACHFRVESFTGGARSERAIRERSPASEMQWRVNWLLFL